MATGLRNSDEREIIRDRSLDCEEENREERNSSKKKGGSGYRSNEQKKEQRKTVTDTRRYFEKWKVTSKIGNDREREEGKESRERQQGRKGEEGKEDTREMEEVDRGISDGGEESKNGEGARDNKDTGGNKKEGRGKGKKGDRKKRMEEQRSPQEMEERGTRREVDGVSNESDAEREELENEEGMEHEGNVREEGGEWGGGGREKSKERDRTNELDREKIVEMLMERMNQAGERMIREAGKGEKAVIKKVLGLMRTTVEETVSGLSDMVAGERERRERQAKKIEDRVSELEEEMEDVRMTNDKLHKARTRDRLRSSVRDMEDRVEGSMSCFKLLDIDIGSRTQDKGKMVRDTIQLLREDVRKEDLRRFEWLVRRTRIVVLGKRTEERQSNYTGKPIWTVPLLFECRDEREKESLEGILRDAGHFGTFHWPGEIKDFVGEIREGLRNLVGRREDNYIRIRPERREGRTVLKAEVKQREGKGWRLWGKWACPAMDGRWRDTERDLEPLWEGKEMRETKERLGDRGSRFN